MHASYQLGTPPAMPSSSVSGGHHRRLLLLALVASLCTVATCKDNPFTSVDCQTTSPPPSSPASSPAPSASKTNSTFRSNVVALLDALPSAAAPTGFASLSRSGAFVRGICRGDSSPDDCAAYLRTAVAGIISACNDSTSRAGIWYDKCFVGYGDTGSASNKHEQEFRSIWYNVGQVSDKDAFEAAYYALMNRLSARVVSNSSGSGTAPMFATGEAVYDANYPNGTMYGLLQCMRDRTPAECDRCLKDSVPQLPRCCYGNQGGVVLGYDCNLRVEIYTYYDLALDAPPPPAPAPASSSSLVVGEKHGRKKLTNSTLAVALSIGTLIVAVTICVSVLLLYRRKTNQEKTLQQDRGREVEDKGYIAPEQLNLTVLRAATNNFSKANKLGEGGFGEVFKGTLQDGEEIAVKRLSRHSSQGFSELKNELVLAAKLKHKNLVQIIGVCLQDENKLVIYEYLPNRSLDTFLFDPVRRLQLDWSKRFAIICGIARGLLYLHEESRLKVIHRDLKPSNVLLDAEMNPKISDFGLARAFSGDQTGDITRRPAGTLGYMSPEYAYYGRVSTKSDMFSFGVIVLEIITGKKSTDECEDSLSLLSYIWGKWRSGSTADVVDLSLAGKYPEEEVLNCLEVGLLCVQENPADRPDASTVVLMLTSLSTVDERRCPPSRPAFVFDSVRGGHPRGRRMPNGTFRTEGTRLIGEEQPSTALILSNEVTISELLPR